MRLGGYSRIGCLTLSTLSTLISYPVHSEAITANGFGSVIQKLVENREAQYLASHAGKVVATGAEAGAMGIAIATSTEIIKQNPDVIDSYRMCSAGVGVGNFCSASSVFSAAKGYADGKYSDAVSHGMTSFGNALVSGASTTWGLLGAASGIIKVGDLAIENANKKIQYFTSGIPKNDGTYDIKLPDGSVVNTRDKPSTSNPVPVVIPSGYTPFLPDKIKEGLTNYNKDVVKPSLPDTFYNVDAPPPITQALPNDVNRMAVKGTAFPYSQEANDDKGHYVAVSNNPVSISLYNAINGFKRKNVLYYENSDENNLHIKIPRSFQVFYITLKDFQFDSPSLYFGGYSLRVTTVYTVHSVDVTLVNSGDICKSEEVPAHTDTSSSEIKTELKYICRPEKAKYSKVATDRDVSDNGVFFNTEFDYSKAPSLVSGNAIDHIGGHSDEPLPVGTVSNLLNNIAGQAITGDNYKGIPLDRPFTPAEITAAANAAGVPLTKDILYQPISVPTTWTNAIPDVDNPDRPGTVTGDVTVDLGENPNTPAPSLDTPPTGEEILKPITELMPDIKNLNIAAKDVQCPKWEFELWEKKYSFDSHCTLLEKIRPVLKAVFLLIWGLVSLRIILSA